MKKRLTIAELQFGMYIAELDRPWTETPFKFQGFVLKSYEELEILGKCCRVVFVDPDRTEGAAPLTETIPPRARAKVDLTPAGKFRWNEISSVEQEYPRAAACYGAAEVLMREALSALRSGKALQGDQLREAVSLVTESVLRNPDAMLLFSKLWDKGDYIHSHALDCAVYMAAFGRFLEMSRDDIVLLGYLGLLQDVGKVKLPAALIDKPGRLIPIEYQIAQKHVEHSAEIIRGTPGLPWQLADLVSLHHERLDGSGYPRRLKGSAIGMIGSIAGIVDTFDALTARRPYAAPISPSEALKILYKARGTLFDTYLVEQFIRCIGIFPLGSWVELNGGELGTVIAQNRGKRLQPRVMVVQDAAGNPVHPQKIIDLSKGITASDGRAYRIKRAREFSKIPIGAMDVFFGV
ncbi:MAG TPA: HD-GYP domain-containing protein [Burkholderiales bacterium]|nr:HD-GYP domain-containing protein [Burkholderiales bacterium]